MMMTLFDFAVLGALIRSERPVSLSGLAEISGYCIGGILWHRLQSLVQLGLVVRPYRGAVLITERGKIAHAIQEGIEARKALVRRLAA